ncbi:catecholate siderophore receptor Fiu [Variovorax sp. J22R133]|uniref:catecholate siderophore receptor Fiu n=1 Tax=Variovorax brevis TaxID=3053503 RepID=UPI00257788B5|nr:catecholate siderophore receptor Fiu [Variovorax sp. J22R133]MDM0113182.1 catecholate siderophore receptor Fiu [Variovorax sp. J22R133]
MAYIKSRKHAVARALPPFGSAAAAATLVALSLPVAAQTNTLKEVRVTEDTTVDYKTDTSANPKFTAPLVDTPKTIQVVPEQVMREQGATTLTEALRNSPGVSAFYLGENGNTSTGDAVYMRGFDASGSIFVDGIRDVGSISRDVFNLESVEVVKGPSSTDVGRTSPGGYINLISKKPLLEDAFSGSVGFGSGSFKRGTLDWNKVVSGADGSGTAFRINAMVEDSGVASRDNIENDRWAIAPSIAFGLNTPTRVYLDYLHAKQSNVPDGGVPTVGLPGYSTPDPTRPYITTAPPVRSRNYYGTNFDFDDVTADMFTARVEHDITPTMTVRNITRYGETSQDYFLTSFMGSSANLTTRPPAANPNDPSTWTIARSNPTSKDQENKIITNQTNLSAKFDTGGVSHSLNTGLELIREEQSNNGYYGYNGIANGQPIGNGSFPAANLYAPNPNVTGYNRVRNGADSKGTTDTVGVYVFDTAKLSQNWQVTGGVRYDHYSTDYDATTRSTATTNPGLPVGTLVPTDLSTSGGLWSGQIGLVYKPAENGSVYIAYGTAAQPPGGANFSLANSGNNASRTDFEPQKTKSTEIGTKWDVLNKKLGLAAALYRTDVSNEVIPDPTNAAVFYQAGKKRVEGLELSAAGALTDHWGVSAGYAYMDTSIVSGPAVTADGTNIIAYAPKNAFTAWTTYQFPMGLTIGGGARYVGKLHRGTDSAIGTPSFVEAYWVFDATVGYRLSKNLDLQLNIYNLFDKEYVAAINKSGYRYSPGIPRSARVALNFAF